MSENNASFLQTLEKGNIKTKQIIVLAQNSSGDGILNMVVGLFYFVVQIKVLTVTDEQKTYAQQVMNELLQWTQVRIHRQAK